jgi:hypothetical protein
VTVVSVVSLCVFPAGVILWEASPGQLSLTVIVKATFALVPGEAVVAPAQDPLREERHWDDNGLASLHSPGDFAPSKRRVDVTLAGHAYAPRGEPATSIVARLVVGDLVKAVRVTGDRVWTPGARKVLEPGPPSPFVRMPLRYERAALSADDPLGIDANAPPVPGAPALANLELPDNPRVTMGAGPPNPRGEATACFGPVASTWRARRRLLDEEAMFWAYGIARDPRSEAGDRAPPLGPAPPRFDFAFFNTAPADQQLDLLRPGTPIALTHLHPQHALLETRLPAMRPQVFRVPPQDTPRARVEEIALRCDSLWIDTDRAVAVVTWRGLADVGPSAASVGRIVVSADPQGKKQRWDRVEKRLGEQVMPTLRLGPDGLPPSEAPDDAPPDPLARRHDTLKGQRPEGGEPAESLVWDAPTNPLDRGSDDDRTQALPELSPVRDGGSAPKPPKPVTMEAPASRPPGVPRPGAPSSRKDSTLEVDVATYARLQIAVERGEVGGVLSDLQLTLGDLLRLQRAWTRRVAASPRLAAELARAVEAARGQGS